MANKIDKEKNKGIFLYNLAVHTFSQEVVHGIHREFGLVQGEYPGKFVYSQLCRSFSLLKYSLTSSQGSDNQMT